MSDFTDFFPAAGATSGGGGGTIVVGSNTYPAPLPSASLMPASGYLFNGFYSTDPLTTFGAAGTTDSKFFNPQFSATPFEFDPIVPPSQAATSYTICDLNTTDYANGGALLQTSCYISAYNLSGDTWKVDNPEVKITVDGVTTSYIQPDLGSSFNNNSSRQDRYMVVGAQPIDCYATLYQSNGPSYASATSAINGRVVGNNGATFTTSNNMVTYGEINAPNEFPPNFNSNTEIFLSQRPITSTNWMGNGLPWVRWTTDLKIEVVHNGIEATTTSVRFTIGDSVKHIGL